jgi:hypothetical protein
MERLLIVNCFRAAQISWHIVDPMRNTFGSIEMSG